MSGIGVLFTEVFPSVSCLDEWPHLHHVIQAESLGVILGISSSLTCWVQSTNLTDFSLVNVP